MGVVIITLVSIENRSKMSKKLRIQHPNTSTLPFDSIEGSGLNSSNLIVVEAQTCDLKKKIFFYLCRHLKIGMSSLLLYQWHIKLTHTATQYALNLGRYHLQLALLNWDTKSVLALNKKLKVNWKFQFFI